MPLADYRAWFERLTRSCGRGCVRRGASRRVAVRRRGRHRAGVPAVRERRGDDPAARGFGENPIAIYHDPDMPPSHHYMAAYRWLENSFGADAIVHMGKHGTMEWLPARDWGWAPGARRDAVLGDLPLIYPFIVNDPGEGTQAKRRGHATVVDHWCRDGAGRHVRRSGQAGAAARRVALVSDLDPAKAPAVRAQIWTLVKAPRAPPRPARGRPADDGRLRRVRHAHRRLPVRDQECRSGTACTSSAAAGGRAAREPRPRGPARLAGVGGRANALPGLRAALAAHFGLVEKELLAEPGAPVKAPVE
ncbi:hypothetical protein GCM10023238_01790 [Streptomyces heliomycini]